MLPAVQPQPEITTLEQYENFPENRRLEVFEGVVYDMASPSQEHQTILTELLVSLRNYIRDKGGNRFVFPAPFDVKLNDNPLTIVQPDLMIICDKDKLDGKRLFPLAILQMIISENSTITKMLVFVSIGLWIPAARW